MIAEPEPAQNQRFRRLLALGPSRWVRGWSGVHAPKRELPGGREELPTAVLNVGGGGGSGGGRVWLWGVSGSGAGRCLASI